VSAIDAFPSQGSERMEPIDDDPWAPLTKGGLHTEGPNPLADLFGSGPGGGDALMNGVQLDSGHGATASGTVESPFSWLLP